MFTRVALGFLIALALGGCASTPRGAAGDDPIGYYEVRYEESVYVLGSVASAEKARAGKLPSKTTRRMGRDGVPVYFETDGAGLEDLLIGEHNRRHGLSQ